MTFLKSGSKPEKMHFKFSKSLVFYTPFRSVRFHLILLRIILLTIGFNKRSEVRLIIRPSSPRRRFVLFFPFRLVVGLIMRPTSAHFFQNPSENETRLNMVVYLIIRSYFKTIFPFMFYLTI